MAVRPRRSPFHNITFVVTAQYGHYPNGKEHRGIDLAPLSSLETGNTRVYSIVEGYVFQVGFNNPSMGNFVRIKDNSSDYAFTYMHLKDNSITVSEGDTINLQSIVGIEGTTGTSTGIHLHVEARLVEGEATPTKYINASRTNPADYMGIKNVWYGEEYIEYYYADDIPPEPSKPIKLYKGKFPWAIFGNRNK